MSEMRRLAVLLVARRPTHFETTRPRNEALARLDPGVGATATATGLEVRGKRTLFEGRWTEVEGRARLEGIFSPVGGTRLILNVTSAVLLALIASCVYAFLATDVDTTTRVLVPIITVIAILGFPLIAVALGSQREAEEAQVTRAINRAFGAEEAPPPKPRQKWDDEED